MCIYSVVEKLQDIYIEGRTREIRGPRDEREMGFVGVKCDQYTGAKLKGSSWRKDKISSEGQSKERMFDDSEGEEDWM